MLHRLLTTESAVTTHTGVVKRWECDHNGHWNVQFYLRAFQMASELVATATTGRNPGSLSAKLRHFRFHRELLCPETMRVESARIATGPHSGWVLHRMVKGRDGQLSATAIEQPAYPVDDLPACTTADLQQALPRGLSGSAHGWIDDPVDITGNPAPRSAVGTIRPADVDHMGTAQWHVLSSLCSSASHGLMNQLGLTAEWIKATNINRMTVETTMTLHGSCAAGDGLEIQSWISAEGPRFLTTRHQMRKCPGGTPCATLEQVLLFIDLKARKPVPVPQDLRQNARALMPARPE